MANLKEALTALDTNLDEHWTSDGQPRLDVVSSLFGDKVSRADIKAINPKFCRNAPHVEIVSPPPPPPDAVASPWGGQVTADIRVGDNEDPDVNLVEETADGLAVEDGEPVNVVTVVLAEVIENEAAVIAEYLASQTHLEAARRRFDKALTAHNHILTVKDAANKQVSFASTVSAYQATQLAERAQKAAKRNQLLSILDKETIKLITPQPRKK